MGRRTNNATNSLNTTSGVPISEWLGMRYGVWRRDICRYTGLFPVEVMAKQWITLCAYPEHSEIHDAQKLGASKNGKPKKFRSFYGIHKSSIPNAPGERPGATTKN